ncbi:putative CCA tRNA nucleotidyltransferase [Rosa chinensis]|uniref:Putative CCA tRNA nucleotidyltransferase n=1 Tax=Rosa chinensis TaxID=74649 RepID=A0A2P6P5L5_ROSCH|nr:tRNA nucleotidyltransferase cca2 [Rosa chinensis]PRQ17230.1 putative CCA tRNA nucleotidyltransferase [Rosa chinensis]
MSTPSLQVRDNIELDETEERIFTLLLKMIHQCNLKTELRVAGGWVRDKLLGQECKDIDIALENMTGKDFAENVQKYMTSVGEKSQEIAVIGSNPKQSKHLETARMRIFGLWIDFVNLRCEEYSDNSRIPSDQKFGTPEQDAMRRDLTINSLFYNVSTKSVEDWTNRGIDDLKSGIIVTPLPPMETLLEDPLRGLRAIRICAKRDGFILDEGLKEAAASDEVRAAFATKISRERIGAEIDLMICGSHPARAMKDICYLKWFWDVFSLQPQCEPPSEGCDKACVAYLDCVCSLVPVIGRTTFDDEQRRLSYYAAMFLPLGKNMYRDKKGKVFPVVNYIFRYSLKQKVSDAESVMKIHYAFEKFLPLLPHFGSNGGDVQQAEDDLGIGEYVDDVSVTSKESKLRVLTGFLLREVKDFWRVALLMCCAQDPLDKNFTLKDRRAFFRRVERAIVDDLGLDKVWDVKPLLDGNAIIKHLQLKSGGPVVSKWQRKVLAWQLAHPSGTAGECIEWMMETHSSNYN